MRTKKDLLARINLLHDGLAELWAEVERLHNADRAIDQQADRLDKRVYDLERDLRAIPRAIRCENCGMMDFEANMEGLPGGSGQHTACRLEAQGLRICGRCEGKGEVRVEAKT